MSVISKGTALGGGVGVGGGGLRLGPVQNEFTSTAARDAYAAANADWLAEYDADRTLVVRVTVGDVSTYYSRPASPTGTDDWDDVTPVVTGPAGMGAIDQAIPFGTLLEAVDDGSGNKVAGAAPLRSTTAGIVPDTNIMSGASELALQAAALKSPGNTLRLEQMPTNRTFDVLLAEVKEDGTGFPFWRNYDAIDAQPFQSRADIPGGISSTLVQFNIVELLNAEVRRWVINTAGTGKFYFRAWQGSTATGEPFFTSHRPDEIAAGNVFDLTDAGLTFETEFLMEQGVEYVIQLVSPDTTPFTLGGTVTTQADVDDPTTLFNTVGQTVPQFSTGFLEFTDERLATRSEVDAKEDSLGDPAKDGQILQSTTAGVRSWVDQLSGTDITGLLEALTGADRLDYNALKNRPAIVPPPLTAPSIDSFTLDGVNQGEDAPFNLSGNVTFRFAISSASNIQGDITILQGTSVLSSTITKTATSVTLAVNAVTLNAGESVTFTIRATSSLSGNPTIERTFTVTAVQAQDYIYLAAEDSSDPSTTVVAAATQIGYTPGNQVVTIPTFTGNKYLKILQRASDPPITQILIGGGTNPFTGFLGGTTPTVGPISPGGVFLIADSSASGLGAVGGSTNTLRIANSTGAAASVQVLITGRSA